MQALRIAGLFLPLACVAGCGSEPPPAQAEGRVPAPAPARSPVGGSSTEAAGPTGAHGTPFSCLSAANKIYNQCMSQISDNGACSAQFTQYYRQCAYGR